MTPSFLQEASGSYRPSDESTWPLVDSVAFVDRFGTPLPGSPLRVPIERLRYPSDVQPKLSVVIVRWGGKKRIDDDTSDEDLFRQGGWGLFGSPPCDWYYGWMELD